MAALRTKTIYYALPTIVTMGNTLEVVYTYVDATSTYADVTADMNDSGGGDVQLLKDLNDLFLVGDSVMFEALFLKVDTNSNGGTRVWEYSKGGGVWGTLTVQFYTGNANIDNYSDPALYWTAPADWATDTLNGSTKYWIRLRVSSAGTSGPKLSWGTICRQNAFAAKTIYIPETTNRTFRSVMLHWGFQGSGSEGVFGAAIRIGLGAAATQKYARAYSGTTIGGNWNQYSGRSQVHEMHDITAYFQSNFGAGASQSITVLMLAFISSALATNATNGFAFLAITYEAEEQETRIKTVIVPIECKTSKLTTSLAEIGTNQIPILNNVCVENSPTERDAFFTFKGTTSTNDSGNKQFGVSIDAEAETQFGVFKDGGQSAQQVYIWSKTGMAWNSVHALKMRVATTAAFNSLEILLYVTYEYNHTASSSICNSIQIPFQVSQHAGLTPASSTGPIVVTKDVLIEEPATIALLQSGISFRAHSLQYNGDALNFVVSAGAQAVRTYVVFAADSTSVPVAFSLSHRIDSGADKGAGITIGRGRVTLTVTVYSNKLYFGAIDAVLYLNYSSGKHASGDGVHNHTTLYVCHDHSNAISGSTHEFDPAAPVINEANYFINSVAAADYHYSAGNTAFLYNPSVSLEELALEFDANGWTTRIAGLATCYPYSSGPLCFVDLSDVFIRWPNDLRPGMNIESTRTWRTTAGDYWSGNSTCHSAWLLYVTYHSITFTVSGSISGFSVYSNLAGNVYRASLKEPVFPIDVDALGDFSEVWYDDTEELFVEVLESASPNRVGRSDDGLAT